MPVPPVSTPVGGGPNGNNGPTGASTCTAGGPPPDASGNPIYAGSGNKYQLEQDYAAASGLSFIRHYNSLLPGWVHNWGMRVLFDATTARVIRPDGRGYVFTGDGPGLWTAEPAVQDTLTHLTPADESQPLWQYTTAADTTEWYDEEGRLLRLVHRNGQAFTATHNAAGLLTQITDPFGRSLQFGYDASNRLAQVTTPENTTLQYAYDAQGRLSQVTLPDSTNRQYLYEDATYPLALTGLIDERGIRLGTWSYDAQGRGISGEYAGGALRYELVYNADGTTRVTDPLGTARTQRYAANSTRKLFEGQDLPCAGCVGDAASQLIDSVTGLVNQSTDYLGFVTQINWDTARKLPTARTAAAGRPEAQTVQTQWHPSFRLPVLVTEAGRTTAYTYDALGNQLTQTVTDTATNQARTWAWTYTAQSLAETMTDPKGGVWRYAYDAAGNRISVKNPLNQETVFTYDAAGRMLTQTEPNGLISSYAYDARGRLLTQNRGGETSAYSYTPAGQLATATLPNGHQVSYSYDAAQRLIAATDNRGAQIIYTLDAAGNRTREEVRDSTGAIALATGRVINALNRVAAIQGATGQTTALAYDANGEPISQTDPLNQTTRQTLDGLRRPTATTFADNTAAAQAWNQLDVLTAVTDPKGIQTSYQTNAFGEVMAETSPDIGSVSYTRNATGEVTGQTDAKGNATVITRDALGRPTEIRHAPDHLASFSYDSNQAGYLNRIDDKSGATSYERDAQGRILLKNQWVNDNPSSPSLFKVSYGYEAGELASLTYPSGLKVFYRRTAGRITSIDLKKPGANKPIEPWVTALTYTALGQPKAWSWSNGDAANRTFDTDGRMASNEFASYIHDAASRITGITQTLWASSTATGTVTLYTTPLSWSAGYDSRNRLTSFTRAGASTNYAYDANSNRLTAVDKVTSDTDLDGEFDDADFSQSTSQALAIDQASNKLLGFTQTVTKVRGTRTLSTVNTNVNYALDANGAMTSDGLRDFEYDPSNRLAKVRVVKDGEAAKVSYLTNALGQRVFKSEYQAEQTLPNEENLGPDFVTWLKKQFGWLFTQAQANTSIGTAYIYDEEANLLGEYDNGSAKGAGRTEYIWLPTEDGGAIPIGIYRNSNFFAVHTDHLGTPRLMTNKDNTPVWQWPYSAFGTTKPTGVLKATPNPKAAITNIPVLLKATTPTELALRFPGQQDDPETGMFYNLNRSYWPMHGAYPQMDPIGMRGGWNRRLYADGNALSNTDAMGLQAAAGAGAGAGAAGGLGGLGGFGGSAGSRGGYDPKTDRFIPGGTLLPMPSWLKNLFTPKSALDRCEAECEAQYDRDMDECRSYSAMTGDSYTFVACKRNAERRLSQCTVDCAKDCK